jgi:hypothetical protein
VENASALSTRRDMFLDERGAGLRVTWHPERDLVVLSVWQGDSCVGTFRMSVQDVPRLSGLLAAALGDWVDQAGPGRAPRAAPTPRARGRAGRRWAGRGCLVWVRASRAWLEVGGLGFRSGGGSS